MLLGKQDRGDRESQLQFCSESKRTSMSTVVALLNITGM